MCTQSHSCMKNPKILLVPYPAQGHVTPMMKLGRALLNRGYQPVIIAPAFIHRRIITNQNGGISCVSFPGDDDDGPQDFFSIENTMENIMPVHLEKIVREADQHDEGDGVACMIVDLLASRAIDVGYNCKISVVGFWPAMFATYRLIAAIPDMVRTGFISDTGGPQHTISTSFMPTNQAPKFNTEHLPWLIGTSSSRTARFKFWIRTLDRTKNLNSLLINSFYPEESPTPYPKTTNKIQNLQIYPIGPLIQRQSTSSKPPSFWEEDTTCIDWLDKQNPDSVIYISFGSWVSPIGDSKLRNLASTLEELGKPFVWVLGSNWRRGLPNGTLSRLQEKGKVVSWAPQMEVLQHRAVGFYLTHCGWNSTMEGIRCGKPLLCYPIAGDQFLNCDFAVEVWRIGIRVYGFGLKEIELGLRKVVDDFEIKKRLLMLKERVLGEEGGCRVVDNLDAFVNDLKNPSINN